MEILEIALKVLAIIGGLSTPIFFIIFFKYNKRIKNNEAEKGEIENLSKIISEMKDNQLSMQKQINDLKRDYNFSESEKIVIEKENNIYKRAFNSQVECTIECEKCPILNTFDSLIKKRL